MSIAFVLWLLTQLSQQQQSEVEIYLHFDIPTNKTLVNSPPSELSVKIEARGWTLMRYALRKKNRTLQLSIFQNSNFSYQDLETAIRTRMGNEARIVQIAPNSIALQLDDLTQKKVPVRLNGKVSTIPQYQLSRRARIIPDSVEVRGPSAALSAINFVETAFFSLERLGKTTRKPLKIQPFKNKQIRVTPTEIAYFAEVEQISEKVVKVPIRLNNVDLSTIRIFPTEAKIVCTVGLSRFGGLEAKDFEVQLDTQNIDLKKDKYLPLKISKYPEWLNVNDISVFPKSVSFLVVKTKKK
jgi:YbbR domain-containing protein